MLDLLVGCPLARRDWIIREWMLFTAESCRDAGIEPRYVFVLPEDDPCCHLIPLLGGDTTMVMIDDPHPGGRDWNLEPRLHRMVELRNELLAFVRRETPDFFLSLDSDILLHERAVAGMVELSSQYDAVGTRCYMSNGREDPSYGMIINDFLYRRDSDEVMRVDAVFGAALLSPAAYAVDYKFHRLGEDMGWAVAAAEAGVTVGWDGRVCSKHVMQREQLTLLDQRCGF